MALERRRGPERGVEGGAKTVTRSRRGNLALTHRLAYHVAPCVLDSAEALS